jgi:hypothetical protein
MTALINKLVAEVGLTEDQATQSLEVIKGFVKEKFPMLGGTIDNVLGAIPQGPAGEAVATNETSWLDKISEVIPGEIGEKIEGFAKKAADTAGEGFEKAKEKFLDLEKKI